MTCTDCKWLVAWLVFFSILFFSSPPLHFYSGFFSTPIVPFGGPPHLMTLGLSPR